MYKAFKNHFHSWRLLLAACAVSLLHPFHWGFSSGIVNGASQPIKHFINNTVVNHDQPGITAEQYLGIYVALYTAGGVFGGYIASSIMNACGRRACLLLISVGLAVSLLPSALAYWMHSFYLMLLGRLLLGVFTFAGVALTPVYLTEISPQHVRGVLNLIPCIISRIGWQVGQVVAIPSILGTDDLWYWLFVTEFVSHFLISLLVCVLVWLACRETPNFLLVKGRDDEAEQHIHYYHGEDSDVDSVISDIKSEIAVSCSSLLSICAAFRDPAVRGGMILTALCGLANTVSGADLIAVMSTVMLQRTGFSHSEASHLAAGSFVFFLASGFFALFSIEKCGRRSMLLWSCVLIALINVGCSCLVFAYDYYPSIYIGYGFLLCICLFNIAYGFGLSCVSFFLYSELVPIRARGAAGSLFTTVYCVSNTLVGLAQWNTSSFFFVEQSIGPIAFVLMYALPMLLITFYLYFCLPETKNRPITDICVDVAQRNSTANFRQLSSSALSRIQRVMSVEEDKCLDCVIEESMAYDQMMDGKKSTDPMEQILFQLGDPSQRDGSSTPADSKSTDSTDYSVEDKSDPTEYLVDKSNPLEGRISLRLGDGGDGEWFDNATAIVNETDDTNDVDEKCAENAKLIV